MDSLSFFLSVFQNFLVFISCISAIFFVWMAIYYFIKPPLFSLFYLLYFIPGALIPFFLFLTSSSTESLNSFLPILVIFEIALGVYIISMHKRLFSEISEIFQHQTNVGWGINFILLISTFLKLFYIGGDKEAYIELHNIPFMPILLTTIEILFLTKVFQAAINRNTFLILFVILNVIVSGFATGSRGGYLYTVLLYLLIYISINKGQMILNFGLNRNIIYKLFPAFLVGSISISILFFALPDLFSFGFFTQRYVMASDLTFSIFSTVIIEELNEKISILYEFFRPITLRLFGWTESISFVIKSSLFENPDFGGVNFRVLPVGILTGQIFSLTAIFLIYLSFFSFLMRLRISKNLKPYIYACLFNSLFFLYQDLYKLTSLMILTFFFVLFSEIVKVLPKKRIDA